MYSVNKRIYAYLILLAVLAGGFVYYLSSASRERNLSLLRTFGEGKTLNELVNIQVTTIYETCGHEVSENIGYVDREYFRQIQSQHTEDLGWQYFEKGHIGVFLKHAEGLCPDDMEKRHLKAVGDYVGIFFGPANQEAQLERITQINIHSLPREWKEKLITEGAEFPNEVEMLEALDSLDEFN